jgi:hypothetical protein
MAQPEEPAREDLQASIAASLRSIAESLTRIAGILSQPRPPRPGRREGRFQPRTERGEPERGYGYPPPGRPPGRGRERFGPRRRWERGPRQEGGPPPSQRGRPPERA